MIKPKHWLWLVLFGSLWGLVEVGAGEILYEYRVPHASVYLSIWAYFMLAMARGVINRPGSSTIVGSFATLFKLVNASPNFCHLVAIFIIGLTFDAFASILMRKERHTLVRVGMTGFFSIFIERTAFALIAAYIVRYERWIRGGIPMILRHIFVSGSLTALAAIALVPLGYWIGVHAISQMERRPRLAYSGIIAALVLCWTLIRIA
ncbi:MAG: hypothetical protein ABIL68_03825 [bacterium]